MQLILRNCLLIKRQGEPDPIDQYGRPQMNGYAIVPMESWLDRKNLISETLTYQLSKLVGLSVPLSARQNPEGFMENSYLEVRRGEPIPQLIGGVVEFDQYAIAPIEDFLKIPEDD